MLIITTTRLSFLDYFTFERWINEDIILLIQ